MSIKRYIEKRHFDKTPEPTPSKTAKKSDGKLAYCVQRHDATRLHYDLRLEVGGALKSWAVPKGPTLDPNEKRLAMMVEDHPLEYGGFEGNIPKGNYGAGSVMLWDRGTYEVLGDMPAEDQLARGDFKFRLHGEKVTGEFALVHIKNPKAKSSKGNEWLLLKKKDAVAQPGWNTEDHVRSVLTGRTQEEIALGIEASAPTSPMPENITPMLAQIGKGDPPVSDDWLYEVKWDGFRAICYIRDGMSRIISRRGIVLEYPELSDLAQHVNARTAILDGEIAALDDQGLPRFELLQQHKPAVLFVFDLLYLDGLDLRGLPLEERKRTLKEVLRSSDAVRYSEHFKNGAALLKAAREQGIEGIIGKRASSTYESRRGNDWVKYKIVSSDSFILCGFTKGERDHFGALILGLYDQGKLVWAGNVGTGFDQKKMRMIHDKLASLEAKKCPLQPEKNLPKKDVTWTRPELVCEVKYANWTEDNKLRAPVFLGLRPDIEPSECVRDRSESAQEEPRSRTPLLDPTKAEVILTIDSHQLKFTNLDKIFYPDDGYRKRDLLNYYDAVAPLIIPYLKDRPLSLKRYPNGIKADFFFQKEVAASFPKWLRMEVADDIRYVIGEDRATLLFLVNLGCIDHNPWMSRMRSLENPDYLLIDLDPQGCGYEKIVEAALLVRQKLDLAELESYPKTTGGDGMHLFIPLEPRYTYEQVRSLAQLLSAIVTRERPDLFTTPRAVSRREKNKVYFDWVQIAEGKTISSPYSVRAYPGAPVSAPLMWREVTPKLRPEQFNISNAIARFDRVGDLFDGVLNRTQSLENALERLSEKI